MDSERTWNWIRFRGNIDSELTFPLLPSIFYHCRSTAARNSPQQARVTFNTWAHALQRRAQEAVVNLLNDKIPWRVGFVICFLNVLAVYQPCCLLPRLTEGTLRKKSALFLATTYELFCHGVDISRSTQSTVRQHDRSSSPNRALPCWHTKAGWKIEIEFRQLNMLSKMGFTRIPTTLSGFPLGRRYWIVPCGVKTGVISGICRSSVDA